MIVSGVAMIADARNGQRMDRVTTLRVCIPDANLFQNSNELKPLVVLVYSSERLCH